MLVTFSCEEDDFLIEPLFSSFAFRPLEFTKSFSVSGEDTSF